MRFYVLVVSTVALINVVTGVGLETASETCRSESGCENSCRAHGKSCCFCDKTKHFDLQACFCCPKDHFCCGSATWRSGEAHCCPNGYSCTKDGSCTKFNTLPATSAVGHSKLKCRPDTDVYVTVDNFFYIYIDGVEPNLKYANDWTKVDKINLPGTAKLITICGANDFQKAGILMSSVVPEIIGKAEWRCFSSSKLECREEWRKLEFNDTLWNPAVPDELNDGKGTRGVKLDNIPESTSWMWCNKSDNDLTEEWDEFCTCRIWLPDTDYFSYRPRNQRISWIN